LAPHFIDVNAWYQACPKPRRRIHFWPISRKRTMITNYFGSDSCSLCKQKCEAQGRARVVVCRDCQKNRVRATQIATSQLNKVQQAAHALAKECSSCNKCFENASTFAAVRGKDDSSGVVVPMANCVCIDCPNTFERHRLRDNELEATEVCRALALL
jgi:hypothetical protein